MQPYQYQVDPSVPGCCCSMPGGAKVVGIIEIIFATLWLIGGIWGTATGNYSYISSIVVAVIMIMAASYLMQGVRMRYHGKFMFYLVAKPILLVLESAAVIYSGVTGKRNWDQETQFKDWTSEERHYANSMFYGVWGFALGFACLYIVVGIINVYVVVQCYRHLKAHPPVRMSAPTVGYVYGQNPTGVITVGQYGQPQPAYVQQPYAQPAPPYYSAPAYPNLTQQENHTFEK